MLRVDTLITSCTFRRCTHDMLSSAALRENRFRRSDTEFRARQNVLDEHGPRGYRSPSPNSPSGARTGACRAPWGYTAPPPPSAAARSILWCTRSLKQKCIFLVTCGSRPRALAAGWVPSCCFCSTMKRCAECTCLFACVSHALCISYGRR